MAAFLPEAVVADEALPIVAAEALEAVVAASAEGVLPAELPVCFHKSPTSTTTPNSNTRSRLFLRRIPVHPFLLGSEQSITPRRLLSMQQIAKELQNHAIRLRI